ncbi:PREDICTED: lipase member J-like, partial [Rhagoletis zephyria]|uniref:lipase member J-like n=1 Tax=Rhagoletis zephyria TaxID=28612 RepID=UPI0008114EF4
MSIQELIEYRGFQSETHFIESADGYRLQTVRIINPHFQKRKQQQLKPVLLYHGYQCSGSMWIIATSGVLQANGTYFEENVHREDPGATGNTLGFVLAAAGYDVWLANSRGNIYSTNHSRLDPAEQEFWNFSADEIIKYDMPALIDYIRSTTKSPTVGYIGHSQGNLVMFGLLASQPKYNQLVKPFIGISPVGFFVEFNIPVIKHLETYRNYLPKLFPRNILSGATRWTGGSRWCTLPLVNEYICYLIYYGLMGSPKEQVDLRRLPIYVDNVMHGSSTRNFVHLLQHRTSLVYYDYGDAEVNQRHYNQTYPPHYDYSAISNQHMALIYSKNDWFLHLADVQRLKDSLKVLKTTADAASAEVNNETQKENHLNNDMESYLEQMDTPEGKFAELTDDDESPPPSTTTTTTTPSPSSDD